jgi:hypothetical protein
MVSWPRRSGMRPSLVRTIAAIAESCLAPKNGRRNADDAVISSTLECSAANGRPIVQWLDIRKNRRLASTDHQQPALTPNPRTVPSRMPCAAVESPTMHSGHRASRRSAVPRAGRDRDRPRPSDPAERAEYVCFRRRLCAALVVVGLYQEAACKRPNRVNASYSP